MNEPKKRGRAPKTSLANSFMSFPDKAPNIVQAYAIRVWRGCSVSLPDVEKEKIVREALEGQGWTMEGIELP